MIYWICGAASSLFINNQQISFPNQINQIKLFWFELSLMGWNAELKKRRRESSPAWPPTNQNKIKFYFYLLWPAPFLPQSKTNNQFNSIQHQSKKNKSLFLFELIGWIGLIDVVFVGAACSPRSIKINSINFISRLVPQGPSILFFSSARPLGRASWNEKNELNGQRPILPGSTKFINNLSFCSFINSFTKIKLLSKLSLTR